MCALNMQQRRRKAALRRTSAWQMQDTQAQAPALSHVQPGHSKQQRHPLMHAAIARSTAAVRPARAQRAIVLAQVGTQAPSLARHQLMVHALRPAQEVSL